ncbi:myelin proteolipid family protein [Nocardioides sp. cx-169]|uniref:myelin proteolipid family protein n=1 Tax=Nocardioides sp. cx-169 TaxID=2899080 RepID=UPI001E42C8C8|nr:myelin proteolipid family protein [Nocardioides sp. cx-169]MCD4536414.1 myelin proteolipid family protein [Nocardioides sp. cx-169]
MTPVLLLLLPLVEKGPDEEDVVAGWTAFGLFGLLILAVAVLGFSLTKHLKRAERSEQEGRYDPPTRRPAPPEA